MGHLTEQMEQVVEAIINSHDERARWMVDFKEKTTEFIKNNQKNVAELLANFRSDIDGAHNVWQTFCQGSQRSFAGKTQQKGR